MDKKKLTFLVMSDRRSGQWSVDFRKFGSFVEAMVGRRKDEFRIGLWPS
jgi:hypothetical protein